MSAYLIVFRVSEVRDPVALAEYSESNRRNAGIFSETYGFSPLVAYGEMEALEGAAPMGIVVAQFPTMADARAWYNSEEYQAVLPLRARAADWRAVLVNRFSSDTDLASS